MEGEKERDVGDTTEMEGEKEDKEREESCGHNSSETDISTTYAKSGSCTRFDYRGV